MKNFWKTNDLSLFMVPFAYVDHCSYLADSLFTQRKHLLTMRAPYKCKGDPWSKVCSSDNWTYASLDFLRGRKGLTDEFKVLPHDCVYPTSVNQADSLLKIKESICPVIRIKKTLGI